MQNSNPILPCPHCGTGVKFRTDPTTERTSCPHCGYVLPHQIAHFKLLQIIGAGALGAVYLGLDTSLERNVAVKVMREESLRNPQFIESFHREIRAAAALNHPNIAQIYSFGEHLSGYYLVTELLAHGSLEDRIEAQHRMLEIVVLDVGIQVASGLKAAYERGILHRDIKPGNILFDQDGTAKVVDFGLARFEGKNNRQLQEEGVWGMPYYIAPEKRAEGKEDCRSDIFSLGGILFHAIAGRAPFEAGTSIEAVLKILSSAAVSLLALAPDCTPQTAEVISRMLKQDPALRPQSYDELLNDLSYAKQCVLKKKPLKPVKEESEFPIIKLTMGLVAMVVCIGIAIGFWLHHDKIEKSLAPSDQPVEASAEAPSPEQSPPPSIPAQPESARIDYTLQLEAAHELVVQSEEKKALAEFEKIQKELLPTDGLQPWIELHMARVACLMNGHPKMIHQLEGSLDSLSIQSFQTPLSEDQYPKLLGLVLLGKFSNEELNKILGESPDWIRACALFDAGLSAMRKEELAEATDYWNEYLQIQSVSAQPWVLKYQPKASDFISQYAKFKKLEKEVSAFQVTKNFDEAEKLLENNQSKWTWWPIHAVVGKLVESNRQSQAIQQKEQEEKEKADYNHLIETEKQSLESSFTRKIALMKDYQFDELLQIWKDLEPSIKTEENRRLINYQIAVVQCLARFKATLVKDVSESPYDRKRIVTRSNGKPPDKLYLIEGDKLLFRSELGPGQFAEATYKWSDMPPSALLELGDFYCMRMEKKFGSNTSEIANRAIALAVFAREYTLSGQKIEKYLTIVRNTKLNMKETINQLFPENPPKF